MGGRQSVPIEAREYSIWRLRVINSCENMFQEIKTGDVIHLTLIGENDPVPEVAKYLQSYEFKNQLEEHLLYRDPGVGNEWKLPLADDVLRDVSWKVNGLQLVRDNAVTVGVTINTKTPVRLFEVCAYISGCVAWFTAHSSIPVRGVDHDDTFDIATLCFSYPTER